MGGCNDQRPLLPLRVVRNIPFEVVGFGQNPAGMSEHFGIVLLATHYTDLQDALELVLDEKTKDATDKRRAALEKAYHAAMALGSRAGAGQKIAEANALFS